MSALHEAVEAAGARLFAASGGRISFDPVRALSRTDDLALAPPGRISPNGTCRLIACADGWIALSLARDDDIASVPALIGDHVRGDPWAAVETFANAQSAATLIDRAITLALPAAIVGEAAPLTAPARLWDGGGSARGVIDLSALWAGPYCGALLAGAGYDVVKVDSPSRPDPTPVHTPALDARLNGRKRRTTMALDDPALLAMIDDARVLITSGRPHALARAGLSEDALFARNPGLLWVAITGHGWAGEASMRVGFGDDAAAAGGLVAWEDRAPAFIGDALADPLTGMTAATLALEALHANQAGLLDVSLAQVAASFSQKIAASPLR